MLLKKIDIAVIKFILLVMRCLMMKCSKERTEQEVEEVE